jgi:hypothetical protein
VTSLLTPLHNFLAWIDTFPSSLMLRESTFGFPILITVHLISLCMFAGLVIMMDLRLAGFGNKSTPISQIQKRLFPWQMVGLVVSSISGFVLVYSQPLRYYGKVLFWVKLGLMALAGLNAMIFHLTTYRSVADWDTERRLPLRVRVAGGLSLLLWAGVIVFGRLTAYGWLTYE